MKNLKQIIHKNNIELNILKKTKGYKCSISGNNYEKDIFNIVKNYYIKNKQFNTQSQTDLAGSSHKNDIECNFIIDRDIGIEIKKYNTPDWMQCIIHYHNIDKKWRVSKNSKHSIECIEIFNSLLNNIELYDGDIPPFIISQLTHVEWKEIKKKTNKWNDRYIDIPFDTIAKLYRSKKCKYIQISNGYGLYHLGDDICNFDIPLFNIEQQLRVRTKIHTRKNKNGFCNLSVTIACQPKNIKKFTHSKYSLDDINKLPPRLIYKLTDNNYF